MPVVVTGAETPLGRAVVEALRVAGAVDIRATVRDRAAVADLTALRVPTAVCDLVDPLRLGAVLEGAHTVIHLDDPLGTWEHLLDAAEDTGLRRIVTVLGPGEEIPAAQPYDLAVVRAVDARPRTELVAALVAADRARDVHGLLDLGEP